MVAEPDPAEPARTVTPLGRLRFAYPDGRHDVEALAVHPDGDVVLVTEGRTPRVLLYDVPAADVVTGGAFDPCGRTLAVRTYTEIFFLPWPLPDTLPAEPPSCFLGDLEPQGEAVAWEGEDALLLSSEADGGDRGRLLRVRCEAAAAVSRAVSRATASEAPGRD